MSKNDKTAGLNPIAMEDINQQISFRSNYIFKLAQKQSDIGVIRPNRGKGTCGYISCLEGLKALGKCPKEMTLDDFTLDFFSKVDNFDGIHNMLRRSTARVHKNIISYRVIGHDKNNSSWIFDTPWL